MYVSILTKFLILAKSLLFFDYTGSVVKNTVCTVAH